IDVMSSTITVSGASRIALMPDAQLEPTPPSTTVSRPILIVLPQTSPSTNALNPTLSWSFFGSWRSTMIHGHRSSSAVGLPAQSPLVQTSPIVHWYSSSHIVPSGTGSFEHIVSSSHESSVQSLLSSHGKPGWSLHRPFRHLSGPP